MNEQTKKQFYKAVYNGALDVLKLAVRDWNPKARANFYAIIERLKKMSKCLNKVELTFFPFIIPPTEGSKILFFDCGELKTGSFYDGRFYSRGVICFPDVWAYVPEEPKKEDIWP